MISLRAAIFAPRESFGLRSSVEMLFAESYSPSSFMTPERNKLRIGFIAHIHTAGERGGVAPTRKSATSAAMPKIRILRAGHHAQQQARGMASIPTPVMSAHAHARPCRRRERTQKRGVSNDTYRRSRGETLPSGRRSRDHGRRVKRDRQDESGERISPPNG